MDCTYLVSRTLSRVGFHTKCKVLQYSVANLVDQNQKVVGEQVPFLRYQNLKF